LAGEGCSRGRSFVVVGVESDLGFLDPPTLAHQNPSTEINANIWNLALYDIIYDIISS
jgi:hypothetical protein